MHKTFFTFVQLHYYLVRCPYKGKGKGLDTCNSAAYMRRIVNSSALQSWKWQLIGMS